MRNALAVLGALALTIGLAGPASALVYKNPAPSYQQGDVTAGLILDSTTRKVGSDRIDSTVDLKYSTVLGSFGIGLGSAGILELHAGLLTGKFEDLDASSGAAYGASLRYALGSAGGGLQHGLLLAYHASSLSNDSSDTDVAQLDAGYGIAFPLSQTGALYAGGVFSQLTGTLWVPTVFSGGTDFESDSNAGIFAGMEFRPGKSLTIGAEVHLVHETTVGFYLDGKF